jgi:hypothetical protein
VIIRHRKALAGIELEAGEGGVVLDGGGRFGHRAPTPGMPAHIVMGAIFFAAA